MARSLASALRKVVEMTAQAREAIGSLGESAPAVDSLSGALGGAADNADRLNAALPGRWDGNYPSEEPPPPPPPPPGGSFALAESSALPPQPGGLAFISGVDGATVTTSGVAGGVIASTGGRVPGTFGGTGGGSSDSNPNPDPYGCGPRPKDMNSPEGRNWWLCMRNMKPRQTTNGTDFGTESRGPRHYGGSDKAVVDGLNSVKSVLETIANNTRPSRDRGQGNI